jgi:hypothetical protein
MRHRAAKIIVPLSIVFFAALAFQGIALHIRRGPCMERMQVEWNAAHGGGPAIMTLADYERHIRMCDTYAALGLGH